MLKCNGPGTASWHVVLGPPGTGKTTRLLELLADELKRGTAPDRIAFDTFTRAACQEALDRIGRDFGFGRKAMPWVRTIHSTAFKLLGLRRDQVMGPEAWREFAEKFGYDPSEFSEAAEDTPGEPPRRTEADGYRYVLQWGRNRRLTLAQALARFATPVSVRQAEIFSERVRGFKEEHGLFDFTDMLEQALYRGIRPDVDVAFIDEAQDLSPLQIALVEMWFESCDRVYVAGDDDQAIYAFQGAEPDWLLRLAAQHDTEILTQSHRVPAAVHGIAQAIIGRNRRRVPKAYRPTAEEGEVFRLTIEEALSGLDPETETFVLARNRMFLGPASKSLCDRRVPYFFEGLGGLNPYGGKGYFDAVTAALAISRGRAIPAESLRALLALVPSRGVGLLPHGVKARADACTGALETFVLREQFGLWKLLDRIASDGPTAVLLRMRPSDREYFAGIIRQYGDVPHPRIRLGTIHSAKGREADHVYVLPDMTRATYDEYLDNIRGGVEAEHRVAYVAVTRAKSRLILVAPQSRRSFRYPAADRGIAHRA